MIGAVIAALWWMLAGAAVAVCALIARNIMRIKGGHPHRYAVWLGKRCEFELRGEWLEGVVTAVSWKGAVAVRHADWKSVWVPKEHVAERVRWL